MRLGKKGNNRHFGMKLHVRVDGAGGIVYTLTTMASNVHDTREVDNQVERSSEAPVI